MWLSYHIPCFYTNRGSKCACFNKDFKAELLKDLEKDGVTYIKLETVKVKMGDDFVDEEILSFYTDDKNKHNVPVLHAARMMGKDQSFIREAMKRGIIDLGSAYQKEGSNQYDFYISPFKLWQLTGYVYKGYEEEQRLLKESKNK